MSQLNSRPTSSFFLSLSTSPRLTMENIRAAMFTIRYALHMQPKVWRSLSLRLLTSLFRDVMQADTISALTSPNVCHKTFRCSYKSQRLSGSSIAMLSATLHKEMAVLMTRVRDPGPCAIRS